MNFKENARPLAMCFLVIGLILSAILEAIGYPISDWFRYFSVGLIGEWFVERGIRKGKSK